MRGTYLDLRATCGSRKPCPRGRATTYGGDLPPLDQVESVPFESPERGAENADGTVENARFDTTSIPREPIGARARKPGAPPPAHGSRENGEAAKLAKERPSLLDLACETLAGMEIGAHHRSVEVRELIRCMSRENPTWGAPRVRSELRLLGHDVAKSTVTERSAPLR